jgi:hypothetical protein
MKKPKYSKRRCVAKNCGCLYDPSAPNQKYCNAHKSTKFVAAKSDTDAEILLRLALSDVVTKQQQRALVSLVAEYLADTATEVS